MFPAEVRFFVEDLMCCQTERPSHDIVYATGPFKGSMVTVFVIVIPLGLRQSDRLLALPRRQPLSGQCLVLILRHQGAYHVIAEGCCSAITSGDRPEHRRSCDGQQSLSLIFGALALTVFPGGRILAHNFERWFV